MMEGSGTLENQLEATKVCSETLMRFCVDCMYNTHIHSFNCPFSGTTRASRYQKGKTNLDFTEARDNE